jgi:hypothetical protein
MREAREPDSTRRHEAMRAREVLVVLALYVALSCAMTWPLVAGLARDVPGDLGDSLLNMWILGWGAESLPRVLAGTMSVAQAVNANIFHPEPLALAFSETLVGQVLQVLPVYHLTHNLILSYNLLFLSTFALSGVGMYLLVHDFTGDRYAAFLAGLIFAFVPYRVPQIGHIQSISAQWMPLALYGFRRYATTRRAPALAGGSMALLMQNWSCGYYLIYFAPLVPLFVVHQIAAAGRLRDRRVWIMFGIAALVIAAGTWPVLALYLAAERVHGFERPIGEIIGFSADVYSYLTASEMLRVLGPILQAWPKAEGELFLGFVPAALAAMGVVAAVRAARREATERASINVRFAARAERRLSLRTVTAIALAVLALAFAGGFVGILFTGGFITSVAGMPIRATNAPRLLWQLAFVTLAAAVVSTRFRLGLVAFLKSSTGLALVSLLLALWLSLGPVARTAGRTIDGLALYGLLLESVPGFAGLRVPARYAMIAAVYLSVAAGLGAAWLMRPKLTGQSARALLVAFSIAFLVEAAFAPMPINQTWGDGAIAPPARVYPAGNAPAVYRQLAALPGAAVLVEFPFGDPAWELRYVYYSTVHWKRLVNGYSGGFPQSYKVRVARLQQFANEPDAAWATLTASGATHAIVHEAALAAGEAEALRAWLESRGARASGRFDGDVLYDLPHAR